MSARYRALHRTAKEWRRVEAEKTRVRAETLDRRLRALVDRLVAAPGFAEPIEARCDHASRHGQWLLELRFASESGRRLVVAYGAKEPFVLGDVDVHGAAEKLFDTPERRDYLLEALRRRFELDAERFEGTVRLSWGRDYDDKPE